MYCQTCIYIHQHASFISWHFNKCIHGFLVQQKLSVMLFVNWRHWSFVISVKCHISDHTCKRQRHMLSSWDLQTVTLSWKLLSNPDLTLHCSQNQIIDLDQLLAIYVKLLPIADQWLTLRPSVVTFYSRVYYPSI